MAIIVCIPFYWMIITSLKGRGAIMSIPVEWIPKEPTLDAYKKLFAMPEFVGSIFNSFYVSVLCTAVRLLCCLLYTSSADTYAAVAGRTACDKLENVVPHSGLIIRSSIDFDIRLVPSRGPCKRGFGKQFIISVRNFVAPNKWVDISTCGDAVSYTHLLYVSLLPV